MSQYTTGTVTVTNGSTTVTGSGTTWSGNVTAGSVFTVTGSGVPYIVASVGSNTSITLTSAYGGTSLSGQAYSLTTSFTTNRKLPYMEQGDVDPATVHKRAMVALDTILGAAFSANRVIYTDGSGNLTNGSGLTFDGTTLTGTTLATSEKVLTTGTYIVLGKSTNNALRLYPQADASGVEIAATDSTGVVAFKPVTLKGAAVTVNGAAAGVDLQYAGVTKASVTSTGLSLSSGQLQFPASQNASADANTLDDYEEGTFTPTMYGYSTAGTTTYTRQEARYQKIGNTVHFWIDLIWTNATGTGDMQVGGLPFTSSSVTMVKPVAGAVDNVAMTAGNYFAGASLSVSATAMTPIQCPTGGGAQATIPIDNAGQISLAGSYFI